MNIADLEMLLAAEGFDPGVYSLDGRHVGFVFSYDIRDEVVDAEVVRVEDGRILRRPEGGYSKDLYAHLLEHCGYRGAPGTGGGTSGLGTTLEGWLALLRSAGAGLLADRADSLPP